MKLIKRHANRVKNLNVSEISAVDAGANEHATWLLKSRDGAVTFGFTPFLVQKGRSDSTEPDDEEGGEEDAEAAEGQDDEDEGDDVDDEEIGKRERAAFLRHRDAAVRKYVMKQMHGAGLIGRVGKARKSNSGADIDGTDMRTAEEQADDAEQVVRACGDNPPAASESLPDWLSRIADALGVNIDQVHGSDLRAASRAYQEYQAQNVLKRRLVETVDAIAKRRASVDKSKSVQQHYRDIVSDPAVYASLRKSGGAADFGVAPVPQAADPGFTMIDNGFGGGSNASGTALDRLNEEAADIEKASIGSRKRLSKQQAFVEACKLNPELYAAHKRGQ